MNIINNTWHIVDEFLKNPKYVLINRDKALEISKKIKRFCFYNFQEEPKWTEHVKWDNPEDKYYQIIAYELILDSINYNFWYGKGSIRPNNSSSYELSRLLNFAFLQSNTINEKEGCCDLICDRAINIFKEGIIRDRYPNLENRLNHLEQVRKIFKTNMIRSILKSIVDKEEDAELVLDTIIQNVPSYASDMFLKRAFLFIIELNRKMGWFENDIKKIPVPADYQIPKVLHSLGILRYNDCLKKKIFSEELIPSGSLMECEIRASTIEACRIIAKYSGIAMANVDSYLFDKRKDFDEPFHLTITTDY